MSIAWGIAGPFTPRRWRLGLAGAPTRGEMLLRSVRDLAVGIGIVRRKRAVPWMWARVGSDLHELAMVGAMRKRSKRARRRSDTPVASVVRAALTSAAALDGAVALWLTGSAMKKSRTLRAPVRAHARITVRAEPQAVYAVFRRFEQLPRFMKHLQSVEVLDDRRSRWTAHGPLGTAITWNAEVTGDVPGERIAWTSCKGADIDSSGIVRFVPAPGDRGTEIHVSLSYGAPGGKVGAAVAKLLGEEPSVQVREDLRRLKQLIETGDVVHSDASIHRGKHPARPSTQASEHRS